MTVDGMTEEERQSLVLDTIAAMEVHQSAHNLWGDPVLEPKGTTDCPVCGLTLPQMADSLRRGQYACAYSRSRQALAVESDRRAIEERLDELRAAEVTESEQRVLDGNR